MLDFPPVTVVILNFNGREHLAPCLRSLEQLTYPPDRVAVHLVDNGSHDGSVAYARKAFPAVKLTSHPENLGFSEAVNRAVEAADTPLVAFLNNDARVDPRWLTELVVPLIRGEAVAAGSMIVDWQGKDELFRGGGCNFHGVGFQSGLNDGASSAGNARPDEPVEILFACGAAMVVWRDVFRETGGFDEDFFAFYEDVDLGWRLWCLGHRVVLCPRSRVYHHHSATASRVPIHQLRVLHVRNPLLTILKNYEQANLDRVFPAALMLSIRRMSFLANLDHEDFRIRQPEAMSGRWKWGKSRNASETQTVPKVALSDLVALEDVNRHFERFLEKRAWVQSRRLRPDREIFPLFRKPYWLAEQSETYRRLQEVLVDFFGIEDVFQTPEPEKKTVSRPSVG
jgi:GT2 family glycosyltransferase